MALHEQCVGATDEWYTPPHVFKALGCEFDMDVASPGREVTPWIPADEFVTRDSLTLLWDGLVWMNPPFGARNGIVPWLDKFFFHGNGIALVPDRTSAPWWQQFAPCADLILFIAPKLRFIPSDAERRRLESESAAKGKIWRPAPAQGTCLFAKGDNAQHALRRAAPSLGVLAVPLSAHLARLEVSRG